MEPPQEPQEHSPEQQARRHLLKLAAYTPPAILGAMLASSKLAQAATVGQTQNCGGTTIVVSASGYACCPCVPSSNRYDPNRCNQARCQLGNCSACRQLVFNNQNQCQSTTAACGSCTCTPIGGGGGGRGHGNQFWVCQ
jgi:hypothetical protein